MTTCRFLFNDYFRRELDGQTGGWGIDIKAGNASTDAEILHTFRDGRLYTSQNFIKQGSDTGLVYITDDLPYAICDTVGLVNTNLIGAELAVGQSPRTPIPSPNFIVKSPDDTGAANVFVDSTQSVTVGSIALVFLGCAHEFNAFYPAGWKPPFLREYDMDALVSETGYPMAIHRRQEPVEYTIPLRFLSTETDLDNLKAVITKAQRQTFLFQWDVDDGLNTLYGWLTGQGDITYEAHGLVSVDLKVEGYYDYGN